MSNILNKVAALFRATATLYSRRSAQLAAASEVSEVGKARDAFQAALAAFPDAEYALTLWLEDDKPVVLYKNGNVAFKPEVVRDQKGNLTVESARALAAYDAARARSGWHPDLRVQPLGSAPAAFSLGGVAGPAGVIAIVGGAGTGKTPLSHAIAGSEGAEYSLVAYGEPLAGYATDLTSASRALGAALLAGDSVVFDSIKDLLSLASGGAMKSGLARGVFPILTHLSVVAADAGVAVFVPVNPSSPDEAVLDLLTEAVASNTTGLIVATKSEGWRYLFRRGEGLDRADGTIRTSRAPDDSMVIEAVVPSRASATRTALASSRKVDPDVALRATVDSTHWSTFQRLIRGQSNFTKNL